ncbi:MAG: hypothetical protein KDC61_18015 [Saprospiraceae bacterium]|nr:hypothetical protein [Saprospiraceae bacterium]
MPAPVSLASDAIIFSINAAIKLSQNLRRAYALSVRSKNLVLPLPDFNQQQKTGPVIDFFDSHQNYLEQLDDLSVLHEKAQADELSDAERDEYLQYYFSFHATENGYANGDVQELSASDLIALFQVRQWKKGKEPGSVLQLVAGTLIEIGIDYYAQVPGALNPKSDKGRVMHAFLRAFDDIPLADNPDLKKDFSTKLVPRLFAAAAESVAELSPQFANDEKVQTFIRVAAKGIADDIFARAGQFSALQKEEAVQWGQLVLRSLINHAGHHVLAAPQAFFGADENTAKIIESSGLVLLESILGNDPEHTDFRNALSPKTLDRLVGATLGILAEHPEMLSGDRNVKAILGGVAAVMQHQSILDKGYLPELARIVLEQSAGRLDQLSRELPGGPGGKHLLITTAGSMLAILSEKPAEGAWKPALSQRQLLGLLEEMLAEVAENPAWILEKLDQKPLMAQVMEAAFAALRALPPEERLSADTLRYILRRCLDTALLSPGILNKVKWGTGEEEKAILTKSLDLVFAAVFRPEVPAVGRLQLLNDLMGYASDVLLRQHPDKKGLVLIDLILFNSDVDFQRGFDAQLADQLYHAAMEALASRPELVAKPEAMRNILSGVAGALANTNIRQPGLAATLVQLILHHTGQNAHLIVDAGEDKPRHLLVTALQQLLSALSATDGNGGWKPGISPGHAEYLLESLLDEVVRHPFWLTKKVQEDALLSRVLETVFSSLEAIPKSERLSGDTLHILLEKVLRMVAASPQILQKVRFADDDQEKEILQRSLDLLFSYVFDKNGGHSNRIAQLEALIEFIPELIISRYPDKRGLILVDLILFEHNGLDFSRGFPDIQAGQLVDAALAALARQPELIVKDQTLRRILADVAAALRDSGLQRPDLLPELIRLALETTAEHVTPMLDTGQGTAKHLFAVAATQVLNALAQPTEDGKWKPRLSDNQLVDILETAYESVLKNPQWAIQETYLYKVLHSVFLALQRVPDPYTVSYALIRYLVEKALEAADRQWELMAEDQTPDGKKQLRLQASLDALMSALFSETTDEKTVWYLSQGHIVEMLIDHYLMQLVRTQAGKKDIEAVLKRIREALAAWKQDYSKNLSDILQNVA